MPVQFRRFWGGAKAIQRQLPGGWPDVLLLGGIFGLLYGLFHFAGRWHAVMLPAVEIHLSPWNLPWYTFQSLMRGLIAYALSLLFTLAYGYWAAKDRRAERVLVPVLDILQSIPVLSFMPVLLLALVGLFPHSNTGLELTAILLIFTGQVWNMTFSFYRSVQTVPREQQEAAQVFGFTWWQRFRRVELPFATLGLVWNSMMSMAGGWFYLMICEHIVLGDQTFVLPGLGSYIQAAVDADNIPAQIWAVVAMVSMVVALDQFLWRPLVAWAQKFRVEEGGACEVSTSWFLDWLKRSRLSHLVRWLKHRARPSRAAPVTVPAAPAAGGRSLARLASPISTVALVALVGLMGWGAFRLIQLLLKVSLHEWGEIVLAGATTLGRVAGSTLLGTLWALPVGLAIGLNPRLSRIFQPIIQIAASFPSSMLFPMAVAALAWCHLPLGAGSMLLMLLGTQWYILFNVIAGAMTIPADLREAAHAYGITGRQRFMTLYLPAVFPYLVTGWITAMGGAWNASIVTEYIKPHLWTFGLGNTISTATSNNPPNLPLLAASAVMMAIFVVTINRTVWRRLYRLGETKFSLEK